MSSPPNGPQFLNKSKPLPSEKFRVLKVLNTLTKHFTNCWEREKSNSSKLTYYNKNKKKLPVKVTLTSQKDFPFVIICDLYSGLYTAPVRRIYGLYMAYSRPSYGLYTAYERPIDGPHKTLT